MSSLKEKSTLRWNSVAVLLIKFFLTFGDILNKMSSHSCDLQSLAYCFEITEKVGIGCR